MKWKAAAALIAGAMALEAQTQPVNILQIDLANVVNYVDDLADPSRKATSPAISPVSSNLIWAFKMNFTEADIVAVNGKPAKGWFTHQYGTRSMGNTVFTPGNSLLDAGGGCQLQAAFMLLQADGTPVGSLILNGTTGGPLPGAPPGATAFNFVVAGGTGAYLGARGQASRATASAIRNASMVEDPAYRRVNGGGTARFLVHLIQTDSPTVITTAAGPAIAHSNDFSMVSPAKPAKSGEVLTLFVTGLGPTKPGVDPGKPFGADPLNRANSPIEVAVNGVPAEVLYAGGYPGSTNTYQVNFRLPAETAAGTATLQVTAAWIAGPEVKIPVQ
jgi:hypothetical protein